MALYLGGPPTLYPSSTAHSADQRAGQLEDNEEMINRYEGRREAMAESRREERSKCIHCTSIIHKYEHHN